MKKIILTIVLATLCLFFKVGAQSQINDIKPLKVGDKLPESFWQQEHTIYQNGKTTTQTLAQYKGKLLLLDFWATWCGSCIKKFTLLDSLKSEHASELAVLLVNSKKSNDNSAMVNQTLKAYNLSSVLADTVLSLNLPHRMLPHYVWIHNDRVFAITDATHVTRYMVTLVLARYLEIQSFSKPKIRP